MLRPTSQPSISPEPYAQHQAPVRPRADYRYTLDARQRQDIAQTYGNYYGRPPQRRQPYCRAVGGYEAYMRNTGQVCWLD